MKVIIVNDFKDVGAKAAEIVIDKVKVKEDLVLGLATGKTMIPFYKKLVYIIKRDRVDFTSVKTFNLDEYIGLSRENKNSYFYYMRKNFFDKVDIDMENFNFLDGKAKDFDLECKRYEDKIKICGGIDIQILGIGRDGHIGFNEPRSSFKSRTRKVLLSEVTRKDNSKSFGGKISKVPKTALTMGISTIMSARKIILLVFGKDKAGIVHRFLHGRVEENIPASVLHKHEKVIVVLDKAAASELD